MATEDAVRDKPETTADGELAEHGAGIVAAAGDLAKPRVPRYDSPKVQTAAEFLLAAFDEDEAAEITSTITVNIGGIGKDRRDIPWTIKALPGPLVRKIREDAEAVVRRAGATGAGAVSSSFQAAVKYVIEASVDPNIKELARARQLADPSVFLEEALNKKQGLIEQISGRILALSGYDQDDVQDAIEVRATGNS